MRRSYKEMKYLASLIGLDVVRHENLGNAKAPYYRYSVVTTEGRERVLEPATLKKVNAFIAERALEILRDLDEHED